MGRGEQAQGEVRESDAAKPKVASSQVVLYVLLGMVALIPLYFSPSFHDYEIPKMVMLKVFAVLLTLLWIAGMVLRGRITVVDTSLYYTFLAFLAVHFISLFQSYNIFQGLDTLFQYFCCFLLVIVVFHVVREERQMLCVAGAMGATGLVVAGIGLLQYNDIIDLYAPWNIPLSTIGNVNYVAEYYDVVFPLAVALIFVLRSPWLRAGAILAGLLMGAHLVVLDSRGGWLGAAVSLSLLGAAAALRHFRVGRRVMDVTFTSIVVAGLGWPVLEGLTSGIQIGPERTLGNLAAENWQRMMGRTEDALRLQDDSSQQRVLLWEDTLRLIFERPLVGVGVGNFEYNIPHHMGRQTLEVKMRMEERQGRELMAFRAHNEYLEVWAETGILGFGVFCFLLYQVLTAIYAILKRYAKGEGDLLGVGFGAAIVASLAHSFFSTNLQDPVSASHFWIAVGLVWSLRLKAEGETRVGLMAAESDRGMRVLLGGCGLVLIVAVALGAQTLLGAYYYHKGFLLYRKGHYGPTAVEMERAARYRYPRSFLVYQIMGMALSQEGKAEAAAHAFRKSLLLHRNNAQVYCYLGRSLGKLNRPEEAARQLRRAVELNPLAAEYRLELGRALGAAGKGEEGVRHLQEAIRLDPSSFGAHHALGVIRRDSGDLKAAVSAFEKALILKPGDPEVRNSLAVTHMKQGRFEKAREGFEALVGRWPDRLDYRINLSVVLYNLDVHQASLEACVEVIRIDPDYVPGYTTLGSIFQELGAFERAKTAYQEALKRDPSNALALEGLKTIANRP